MSPKKRKPKKDEPETGSPEEMKEIGESISGDQPEIGEKDTGIGSKPPQSPPILPPSPPAP